MEYKFTLFIVKKVSDKCGHCVDKNCSSVQTSIVSDVIVNKNVEGCNAIGDVIYDEDVLLSLFPDYFIYGDIDFLEDDCTCVDYDEYDNIRCHVYSEKVYMAVLTRIFPE